MNNGQTVATVDLGSNSFRIEIAKVDHDQLVRLDYYKEPVRLGAGFDTEGKLTPEAIERGVACLTRFSERLRGVLPDAIRAVATQSLRSAKNPEAFLIPAQAALGCTIEIISGQEEARLIYQGVANDLPKDNQKRLVVDIGGGSTEVILGTNTDAHQMESFRIGCVSHTLNFFPQNKYNRKNFDKAVLAAMATFEEKISLFSSDNWQLAYGSSGTIEAISELSTSLFKSHSISIESMQQLAELMITTEQKKWPFPNIKTQRAQVMMGGLAVLIGLFKTFNIKSMQPCYSALRQGVMIDLIGRNNASDVREQSINRLSKRYLVDAEQACRVEKIALQLLKNNDHTADTKWLSWAARCHEIGLSIAHEGAHQHGGYIMRNADLAGFSRFEQAHLADLIVAQRGGLKKWQSALINNKFACEVLCLRIAVLLSHARVDIELPNFQLKLKNNQLHWGINQTWLDRHPLSAYLLTEELQAWEKIGRETFVLEQPL